MSNAAAEQAGATSPDFLGMSDEDFLKINAPEASEAAEATTQESQEDQGGSPGSSSAAATEEGVDTQNDEAGSDKNTNQEPGDADDTGGASDAAAGAADEPTGSEKDKKPDGDPAGKAQEEPAAGDKGDKNKPADKSGADGEGAAKGTEGQKKDKPKSEEAAKSVDYEGFFKQVMTPFKANGRTIELKTPEEAIRLMQMGAGYGRKIQDLQPHLKVLRMLEKNDLLDESKLSFLIDINDKNPDAIKKIIKDAGLDPLDMNIGDNVDYAPKNHAVSDKEMAFTQALENVQNHETGQETLRLINQTWDQESKSALWESPELLGVIQTQRDQGVYPQIVAEIDRQKLLGQIPPSTPFLQAYKMAGDHLLATKGFKQVSTSGDQEPQNRTQSAQGSSQDASQPQVIAVRPAAPKAQVQNGDKVAAASSTKSSPTRKPSAVINPLEMADDDFLKQFKDRL